MTQIAQKNESGGIERDTAAGQKLQPHIVTMVSDVETPVSAYSKLSRTNATAFLFESSESDLRLSRFSFIGVDPIKTIEIKNSEATIKEVASGHCETIQTDHPLKLLEQLLEAEKRRYVQVNELAFLPFAGGLVGYLGYGLTKYLENIPQQNNIACDVPDAFYGLYDAFVAFDHARRRIYIVSYRSEAHARTLQSQLLQTVEMTSILEPESRVSESEVYDGVEASFTKEDFLKTVTQCKEYIAEGQVFQIVLAQRFSTVSTKEALTVYRAMQAINPSSYAYLLKCDQFSYIGSSPETFVSCQNGTVVLRALAGTRKRGETDEQDVALGIELRSNEKELAEHHMLVDLARNDLGRICRPGTISVGEIATLVRFSHVMHLSTDVTGTLNQDKSCFDVIASCFPCGTVSGAPKIRAMQLLSKLEPERRGIYSGAVGYFDFRGNTDGAIAIRSALLQNGHAFVNAGAGVVFDSDELSEYEETRNKARSVLKAIKIAEAL
ncbi:MAG: anthranilate synthase component I family protein [Candidatus Obscuribacterales bacterium]|nr:anthranilate synthase component I family protein [Candidatus Obscuribacterales bacterium]